MKTRESNRPEAANSAEPKSFGLLKAAYSVNEMVEVLSIGRTSLYAAVKRGDLNPVKFGKKTLFCRLSLLRFFADSRTKRAVLRERTAMDSEVFLRNRLALVVMTQAVDPKLCATRGVGARRVLVLEGGSARRAGVRDGDYVISANGNSLADLRMDTFASGRVKLRIFREGQEEIEITVVPDHRPRGTTQGKLVLNVPRGVVVQRHERLKWLAVVSGLRTLRPLDKAIMLRLVTYFASRDG
jgi:Helix-turn-helix domain